MDIKTVYEQIKGLNYTVIAAFIAAVAAVFVGILNYIAQRRNTNIQQENFELLSKNSANTLVTQKISDREKQLSEFYKPFNAYLSESAFLYKLLREGLPTKFRTLVYLVDKNHEFENEDGTKIKVQLNQGQLEILKRIFTIEEKLYDLIITKGGMIEDAQLISKYQPSTEITDILLDFDPKMPENLPEDIGLLSLFMVHCTLIKLAYEGQLNDTKTDSLKKFVYPRELNQIIDKNIKSLTTEINTLKSTLK